MFKEEKDLVYLAKIVRVRGLKGEVKVVPYTEDSRVLGGIRDVFIINEKNTKLNLQIKKLIKHKNFYFISFNNIDSIEQAQELVGFEIAVEKSFLPSLPSDNFYIFQLVYVR